jgi:hypothetical protein
MLDKPTPQLAQTEAAQLLHDIRDSMQTPESFGRGLLNVLLTESAANGKFMLDGTIEVPMTAKLTLPGAGAMRSDVCGSCCITAFGHEVICVQLCHHEQ